MLKIQVTRASTIYLANTKPIAEAKSYEYKNIYDEPIIEWYIEIENFNELEDYIARYGDIIISPKSLINDNYDYHMEIYDDYVE